MDQPQYSLAVVIPCYNEESRLPREQILEWAAKRPNWLWLLVDDGSRDRTGAIIQELGAKQPNIRSLILPRNSGKAEAVRQGLIWAEQHCTAPWMSYLDADFAASPSELQRMFDLHASGSNLFILGCRLRRLGALVKRSARRHYFGRFAATVISLFLRMPTYDTQCGAKLIGRKLVPLLLDRPFLSRWLFDVELLARGRNHYGRRNWIGLVVEEPLLEWQERAGTKLRPRDLFRIPFELWRLHVHYNCRVSGRIDE